MKLISKRLVVRTLVVPMVVAVMVAKQENVAAIVVVTDVVVTQLTAALSKKSLFLFTFPSAPILVSIFKYTFNLF